MLGADEVAAYLARLGLARPRTPDLAALTELQHRHLLEVPFENLSVHLDEPIQLDERALVAKIVDRRRGGFCYELNGAFGALLEALGFDVTVLAARVHTDTGLGPPFDHLALRVELAQPWLVDVGFGRFAVGPLRLDHDGDQTDPGGTFRVQPLPDGDLDVWHDGRPAYRLDLRPRALADFEATCWWHRTSPHSHFTRSLVCSRLTGEGRVTLSGTVLVTTVDGAREERALHGDEVLAVYRDRFGIVLDRLPEVRGADRQPA